jgi:KDO2-lipid IV(A) lauroyltransferase
MRSKLKLALDYLAYLAVRLLICFVQSLRLETCATLARGLATLCNDVLRLRAKVMEENLRIAFPAMSEAERRRLSWRMWEHLFLMVAEVALARRKIHDTNWRQYIRFRNKRQMMQTLFARRPSMAVSGHFGNFEMAGYTLGLFGFGTYSVARPLDNPFLDRFVDDFRTATGEHILPKNGSSADIAGLLADGGTLSVLADQHAGPKGCWVDFFGRPASTHKAIALFALGNEAPLMVGFARRLGGPLQFEMGLAAMRDPRNLPADQRGVTEMTQWFTSELETLIRANPEQYWWVHRRWKDSPPKRAAKAA